MSNITAKFQSICSCFAAVPLLAPHADTQSSVTVRRTPMAPHTRLLSNNNDSDLLEISGVRGASGRGRLISSAVYRDSETQQADKTRRTFGAQKKKGEDKKKTLSTFLPLRKVAFSPPAPSVVPCHPPHLTPIFPPPFQTAAAVAATLYWYSAAQVSEKAKPFKHLNRRLFRL